MDLANDPRIAPRGHGETFAAPAAGRAVPDWSGLHARLSAAHSLRREMARGESASAPLCGSFSDWPVPGCDGPYGKRVVNLKDSTDRKGPWGNGTGIAGHAHAGDREQ
jgi:hypothetical protein